MLSGAFLDRASRVLQLMRSEAGAFGGLQLLISGDFLQLPPVQAENMAFEAQSWEEHLGCGFLVGWLVSQLVSQFDSMLASWWQVLVEAQNHF